MGTKSEPPYSYKKRVMEDQNNDYDLNYHYYYMFTFQNEFYINIWALVALAAGFRILSFMFILIRAYRAK